MKTFLALLVLSVCVAACVAQRGGGGRGGGGRGKGRGPPSGGRRRGGRRGGEGSSHRDDDHRKPLEEFTCKVVSPRGTWDTSASKCSGACTLGPVDIKRGNSTHSVTFCNDQALLALACGQTNTPACPTSPEAGECFSLVVAGTTYQFCKPPSPRQYVCEVRIGTTTETPPQTKCPANSQCTVAGAIKQKGRNGATTVQEFYCDVPELVAMSCGTACPADGHCMDLTFPDTTVRTYCKPEHDDAGAPEAPEAPGAAELQQQQQQTGGQGRGGGRRAGAKGRGRRGGGGRG